MENDDLENGSRRTTTKEPIYQENKLAGPAFVWGCIGIVFIILCCCGCWAFICKRLPRGQLTTTIFSISNNQTISSRANDTFPPTYNDVIKLTYENGYDPRRTPPPGYDQTNG